LGVKHEKKGKGVLIIYSDKSMRPSEGGCSKSNGTYNQIDQEGVVERVVTGGKGKRVCWWETLDWEGGGCS